MWQLQIEKGDTRTYRNSTTGSECVQTKCYKDKDGNSWWEFQDLSRMPFTRRFAAEKIIALYLHGITPQDADQFFAKHKATLRAKDDAEKYERAYSELLDFENKFKTATDPVKKMSSLVCVYYTINDEPIDSFANDIQIVKLSLLESQPEMHNFFLSRQIDLIEYLVNSSLQPSPTVSAKTDTIPN